MIFSIFIIFSYVIHAGKSEKDCTHFNYADPNKWMKCFSDCGGDRQSPIDLDTDNAINHGKYPPFEWLGYDAVPEKMTIVNNGHTVQIDAVWENDETPCISGGALNGDYVFEQLHFHWSHKNNSGSEHTIDCKSFPLEMHLVHYKINYCSLKGALKHKDGLAVVGILFEIGETNDGITAIMENVSNELISSTPMELPPFPLSKFNLDFASDYFTYAGSLTTPPCTESVIWTLPIEYRTISFKELEIFRSIKLNHHDNHNNRPTQPLNNRRVFCISGDND